MIFAAMALAFALTTVMAATMVIAYTGWSAGLGDPAGSKKQNYWFLHCGFILESRKFGRWAAGGEVTMNSPLVIVLVAIVLVAFGTLVVMNNACETANMNGALRRPACGTR
jgi:hypothetical protein